MLNWAMKMGERLPIIGEQLKEVNAQNREAIAIAKEKADIDKQARTNEVENAKDALRVAELRKQAKDKENNTAKERLAAAPIATQQPAPVMHVVRNKKAVDSRQMSLF